jgi:cytochrome c oxidase cbb3-type subunit 4
MITYETMRHFADSYGLIAMAVTFLVLCAWPFRPGANKHNQAAANSIFEGQDDGE